MTDEKPSGNWEYTDEQFRELIPEEEAKYITTVSIKRHLGCTFQTVNRRVAQLAKEEPIDIIDLEAGEIVDPESVEESSRPMFGYGEQIATALEG